MPTNPGKFDCVWLPVGEANAAGLNVVFGQPERDLFVRFFALSYALATFIINDEHGHRVGFKLIASCRRKTNTAIRWGIEQNIDDF